MKCSFILLILFDELSRVDWNQLLFIILSNSLCHVSKSILGNYKNYTSYIKDRIIAVNGKIEYTFSNNINSSINIDNGVI